MGLQFRIMSKGGVYVKMILNLLSLISFSPFVTDVTEKEIGKNMDKVKKQSWFQPYLQQEPFRYLVIHDPSVREAIGSFRYSKLDIPSYQKKCEDKLRHLFQQKIVNK